jgi:hypothetical protein
MTTGGLLQPVDIISHSLGGLVVQHAQSLLQRDFPTKQLISRHISLGAPVRVAISQRSLHSLCRILTQCLIAVSRGGRYLDILATDRRVSKWIATVDCMKPNQCIAVQYCRI